MTRLVLILMLMLLVVACESTEGLQPVTGVGGQIEYTGSWPDSITAAAVVILDPAAREDPENIGVYLLSYSNPSDRPGEYFIQLRPGEYFGAVVGLTVDPGLFAANIEYFLSLDTLPLVVLTGPAAGGIYVPEGGISAKDWAIAFN